MKRCIVFSLFLSLLAFGVGIAHTAQARELIVSAAASLTDAFSDIEPAFEKAHPGVDVVMNFASSGALYRQIEQGAPADVYASANPKWMNKAVENGFVNKADAAVFARNSLVLATPADNPAGVKTLKALSGAGVKSIGIGTPETVPAGQYAKGALVKKGVFKSLTPKMIYAESVRQVLDYLSRGEVDCGFVYRTDAVKAGDKVRIIEEVPLEKTVTYPIAVLKESSAPDLAKAFVAFVRSDQGAALLKKRGFKKP
mgnify:CR=1 FL=1